MIEAFPALRADLDRVLAAGTMVEVVDAVATEQEPSHRLFLLLQRGLRALDSGNEGADLVTSFLLKLTEVIGFAPALDRCASCGRSDVALRFSLSEGGAICTTCRPTGTIRLTTGLTRYLSALATSDLSRLPPSDPRLSGEALGVTRRFLEHHLERKLSSLAVLHE